MFDPRIWKIEPVQIEWVEEMIDEYKSRDIYQHRLAKNVRHDRLDLSRENYWEKLIGCVITSQQRSGPGTKVHEFMNREEFPLQLANWPEEGKVNFAQNTLADNGLPGRKKGKWIAQNHNWFQIGGAEFLMQMGEGLREAQAGSWKSQINREVAAAVAVQPFYKGIGPKQGRNYWQWLGLSQYEIPLDSRILNWIESMPATHPAVEVEQNDLSDEQTYRRVMSWIQGLSKEAEILPCLLDIAVFLSQQD